MISTTLAFTPSWGPVQARKGCLFVTTQAGRIIPTTQRSTCSRRKCRILAAADASSPSTTPLSAPGGEALVTGENVAKSYDGTRVQLDGVSFVVPRGARIGLVGKNGTGKSTLLRVLAGSEEPDSGSISRRKQLQIGMLDQRAEEEVALGLENATVRDAVFAAKTPLMDLLRRWNAASADADSSGRAWEKLSTEMDAMDAWAAETFVSQVLSVLGVGGQMLKQPVGTLSGGQRKRVALSALLVSRPELIILDEPTNQLDVASITWLESLLSGKSNAIAGGGGTSTVLLVTHDRYFLDNVCTEIWELDGGKLNRYFGDFQGFVEGKERRVEEQQKLSEVSRNQYRREIVWIRKQPKARGTKSKSRVEAFQELEQRVLSKQNTKELELEVKITRMGSKVLTMRGVSLSLGHRLILDNFSYEFQRGERVGVVGKSGVGKSTFLNVLSQRAEPDSGEIEIGETIVFGFYEQSATVELPANKRVAEYIKDVIALSESEMTPFQILNQFQFSKEQQFTVIEKLSGGERRRLQMLSVLARRPNFLVLDEPSNDLDLNSLEILENFLLSYDGCLVVVSHDRAFMDSLTDHLLVFEGEGKVRRFNGTFSEYLEHDKAVNDGEMGKMASETNAARERKAVTGGDSPRQKNNRKLSYMEKREFEFLESEIDEMTGEFESLQVKLSNPPDGCGYSELAEWTERLAFLELEVDKKTERWVELSERA